MTKTKKVITKTKVLALILIDVVSLVAIWSFVQSQRIPPAELQMIKFEYDPNYAPSMFCPENHSVTVNGTVFNAGATRASNVTIIINVLVKNTAVATETIKLGSIPAKASIPFGVVIAFSSKNVLSSVSYELFWVPAYSGFFMDVLWLTAICVTASTFLLIFNAYCAHELEFFKWMVKRKREITLTLLWSTIVAIIFIKSYWLTYTGNPLLTEFHIAWTGITNWIPRLSILDLILIFALSAVIGAVLLDFETSIFSLLASYALSFLFAIIYVVFFIWFNLGYGELFAPTGGFLEWGPFITYIAFKIIFRMAFPLVQVFCLFGVLVGIYARGYLQPMAESYTSFQESDLDS